MLGDILGFGGKLIGSFVDSQTASANRQLQERNAANNLATQREFAQSGVRWRVEDAKAAGIHPALALGANLASATPVSLGDLPQSNYASTFGSMGQDLGRAINSTRTAPEREAAMAQSAIQLEGMQLDNDIKRASLASSLQRLKANANPPFPVGEADKAEDRPLLYMGGNKWGTNPNTSNMEEYEKRYGDDGPVSWLAPLMIGWEDIKANYGQPGTWPAKMVNELWRRAKADVRYEYDNARRFFGRR